LNSRHLIPKLLLIVVVLLSSGCSNRKNTALSRFWHKLNTRYNGYFNACEALKEGTDMMRESRKDNFTEIIPVFEYGAPDNWTTMNPYAERILEKGAKMIRKHSMLINGKQHNTWIDNCYLIMGKANYFKKEYFLASGQLRYAANETESEQTRQEAYVWLFKLYNSMDEFADAGSAMRMVQEGGLKGDLRGIYHAAQADYYLRQQREDEALRPLEHAIQFTKRKRTKARYQFIIGQIHKKMGNNSAAYEAFKKVLEYKPPYELEFQAKINMAQTSEAGDGKNLRRLLKKMLRDDKNIEYQDQIYYALAMVDLAEGKRKDAIKNLEESARVSQNNPAQKGLSYLKLAELYLEDQAYEPAQAYYDSTSQNLPESHPEYAQVILLRDNLSSVVEQLRIIQLNDSLLMLASLDPEALRAKFEKYVEQLKVEDEKRAEQAERSAAAGAGSGSGSGGAWYFGNNQAMSMGYNEFKKVWGDRKLEDNWRRSRKQSDMFTEDDPDEEGGEAAENPRYNVENYLKGIPTSDSAQAALRSQTEDALYALGVVYRDKIHDLPHSNEAFLELEKRNPQSRHFPLGLYNLYLNFNTQNNKPKATEYREKILKNYPTSEYARILSDPNYLAKKDAEANKAVPLYSSAYAAYRAGEARKAQMLAAEGIRDYPENKLRPRFELLFALAGRELDSAALFPERLRAIVTNYKETESAETAARLLALLGEELPAAPVDTSVTEADTVAAPPKKEYPYKYNDKTEHMVVLIIDDISFNPEELKNALSNFNDENFASNRLTISNTLLANRYQLLNIRRFPGAREAKNYVLAAEKSNYRGYTKKLPTFMYAISLQNLGLLFREKDVEGYGEWYQEHYGK